MTLEYQLEEMIDDKGLVTVLDALASVCYEKSVHIEQSYGDETLSKQWERLVSAIEKLPIPFGYTRGRTP